MVSWDTRRLSSLGYWVFNHPETCSGDQSNSSLLATTSCCCSWRASGQGFGRNADFQAWSSASLPRYSERPPCRPTSRLTVDAARSRCWAILRIDDPQAIPREMSSRSGNVSTRSERRRTDRKSTRLNSSHANISYAVFCLKKKKKKKKEKIRMNEK